MFALAEECANVSTPIETGPTLQPCNYFVIKFVRETQAEIVDKKHPGEPEEDEV